MLRGTHQASLWLVLQIQLQFLLGHNMNSADGLEKPAHIFAAAIHVDHAQGWQFRPPLRFGDERGRKALPPPVFADSQLDQAALRREKCGLCRKPCRAE